MGSLTYVAKREIETTGFSKIGIDFSAIGSDDSFNAATTDISGLLTDQWLQAAGFVKNPTWFQIKSNSTSAKVLTNTPPVSHLRLPGVAGNYASTPDTAANSITGDIDIRVKLSMNDWIPGGAVMKELVAKWVTSGNQLAYAFGIGPTGAPRISWSTTGANNFNVDCTAIVGAVDGTVLWVRVTMVVASGTQKFYTSSDGVVWTQLGSTNVSGATSVFNSTAPLEVGSWEVGTAGFFPGRIYYAEVRSVIDGTIAAAFDPTRGTRGGSSLVALTGETWTINTSGTPPALLQGPPVVYEGAEYLSLPGVTGNNASTPDSAAVSSALDIDLRVKVALIDYTPSASQVLISKYINAGQRSYDFFISTDGKLNFTTSSDGTANSNAVSSVATGLTDGSTKWLRVTRVYSTGVVKFYMSDDYDPMTGTGAWTQLGADSSNTSGGIFDGTDAVRVGQDGGSPSAGKFYYAEIRKGIAGEVVAAFDPGRAAAAATSLTAYTGEVWTINTSGSPAAALVRTTPVTITGYKRGSGQSYSLEFYTERSDRSVKVKRSSQQPIGGGAAEVLLHRQEVFLDVTVIGVEGSLITEAQMLQYREFLASVAAGETFTFDRYGTIAAPVEPKLAQLASDDYMEERIAGAGNLGLYKLSFQIRLLN